MRTERGKAIAIPSRASDRAIAPGQRAWRISGSRVRELPECTDGEWGFLVRERELDVLGRRGELLERPAQSHRSGVAAYSVLEQRFHARPQTGLEARFGSA